MSVSESAEASSSMAPAHQKMASCCHFTLLLIREVTRPYKCDLELNSCPQVRQVLAPLLLTSRVLIVGSWTR